jgi:hypothetical protein
MDQNQDFSKLRDLLALTREDFPRDTQVDQFLIEFHRRQRAQLLVKESAWSRATGWIGEKFAAIRLGPTLSYGSAFAAVALVAVMGLSRQVEVTQAAGHPYQLSFRLQSRDSALAMLPGSLGTPSLAPKTAEALHFASSHADAAPTRFVLSGNNNVAYDSTVAF